MYPSHDITIRLASAGDARSVWRLAALDSRPAPNGRVLLAEIGGRLQAARSIESGRTVADPFEPTADLVRMLEARAGAIRAAEQQPAAGKPRRRARAVAAAR